MLFYLGVPEPAWLARTDVPLLVSRSRLRRRKTLPRAGGKWALDSGAFSALSVDGEHEPAILYVQELNRYAIEIGGLEWAAPQDWMCEPGILARTGLTVQQHQVNTVRNWLEIQACGPSVPIIPVLQGFTSDDYLRCLDRYYGWKIELHTLPLVGLGSVCRRQSTKEIAALVQRLHHYGLKLHGFGVKTSGLRQYGEHLVSADSMAWSFGARFQAPGKQNSLEYALAWRNGLLATLLPDEG